MIDKTQCFNMDCLPAMREFPDKYFDLAIVDPPFPINSLSGGDLNGSLFKKDWYDLVPKKEYFNELKRVSCHQIIWGGNYFTDSLQANNNWIIWYKNNAGANYSMCEMAWCSITKNIQLLELRTQQTRADLSEFIHPCPKPVKLYKWLLKNYAKEGDKILDSHVGSGSSRIACYDMGYEMIGYELDTDYFNAQEKRFAQHKAQLKLFV